MKKKKYIAPRVQQYEMETAQMIAESIPTNSEQSTSPQRAKRGGSWDYENDGEVLGE